VDETAARDAFETALKNYRPAFGTFFLARLFGLEISYTEDSCIVEIDVKDFMFNPQGSLHGGVIAFALDVSMGHLINHTLGAPGITLEMKTQYLRPIGVGRVRCAGRFLKRGRRVSFMETRLTGADGKLAAIATATWHMPGERRDEREI
jgi:uncharacterized protein (TIGR00369 family)